MTTSNTDMALPFRTVSQRTIFQHYAPLQLDSQAAWKQGSLVKDNGDGDEKVFCWTDRNGTTHKQAYGEAADLGLAAGRLYIDSWEPTADGENWRPTYISSGMCFEGRYFITASGFTESDEEAFGRIMEEDNPHVYISTAQDLLDGDVDTTLKKAFLFHYDDVSGISVLELQDDEEDWEIWVAMSQIEYPIELGRPHIWCVGYAAGLDVDSRYYEECWMAVPKFLKDEKLLEKYELRDNQEPPEFNQIFHPHRRIILSGSLGQYNEPWFEHSIPGWYGMDGSMIGRSVQTGCGAIQPKIIGLFKGTNTFGLYNHMVPFTRDAMDQFKTRVSRFRG